VKHLTWKFHTGDRRFIAAARHCFAQWERSGLFTFAENSFFPDINILLLKTPYNAMVQKEELPDRVVHSIKLNCNIPWVPYTQVNWFARWLAARKHLKDKLTNRLEGHLLFYIGEVLGVPFLTLIHLWIEHDMFCKTELPQAIIDKLRSVHQKHA
jgi:hypothetical protein